MADNFATDSCHSQHLIRAIEKDSLQLMVASTKEDFAARLNKACDNAKPPIPEERGRRAELRRRVETAGLVVSGESVRKWLSGESIPSMDSLRFIAMALGVETDWLLTGRTSYVEKSNIQPLTISENKSTYQAPQISQEARVIAEYYDRLPAYLRAEFRASMAKAYLQVRIQHPDADIGDIADVINLVRNN